MLHCWLCLCLLAAKKLLKLLLLLPLLLLLKLLLLHPLLLLTLLHPLLLLPLLLLLSQQSTKSCSQLDKKADASRLFYFPQIPSPHSTDLAPRQPCFLCRHTDPLFCIREYLAQRADSQRSGIVLVAEMRRHQMLQSAVIQPRQ